MSNRAIDQSVEVAERADGLVWYDVRQFGLEGRGWTDTEAPYDRLPARAKDVVRPPVWDLSHHSAGIAASFVTDANAVHARWTVLSTPLAMDHMAATGVSGLDLYAWDEDRWRWAGVGRPDRPDSCDQAGVLTSGLRAGPKTFRLYLPLYNGVKQVWVGLPEGASIAPAAPRPAALSRPICIYGSSIVQGGCASRPGMAYPAILGRRLGRPVINLGFSGNGPMDLELAPLLAELDPVAYVLDSLPNMSPQQVTERAERFVTLLREARPATPIVVVENIVYQRAPLLDPAQRTHEFKNAALREVFQKLTKAGVRGLSLVPGDALLGDDGEATVDGTHPTDVGFQRLAAALEPVLLQNPS
jgi:lysophospholipase L1-like esterase